MNWFLVGDLIQSMCTVVISPKEGDMEKYFKSLQRIIDLKPKIIIPSHGIPTGGTYKLEETLKHRKMREQQIIELTNQGKTPEEILDILYTNIPPKLFPFAALNIQSHLIKIKKQRHLNK
jgi:glyoxylase-like metal-dependent hydrolase (beta-lactamase superfamily II)